MLVEGVFLIWFCFMYLFSFFYNPDFDLHLKKLVDQYKYTHICISWGTWDRKKKRYNTSREWENERVLVSCWRISILPCLELSTRFYVIYIHFILLLHSQLDIYNSDTDVLDKDSWKIVAGNLSLPRKDILLFFFCLFVILTILSENIFWKRSIENLYITKDLNLFCINKIWKWIFFFFLF